MMNDAKTRADAEVCQDILTKAAETLRIARRSRPAVTIEQGERAALQRALSDLVTLYICDPTSIGGDKGATWILGRIQGSLNSPADHESNPPTSH